MNACPLCQGIGFSRLVDFAVSYFPGHKVLLEGADDTKVFSFREVLLVVSQNTTDMYMDMCISLYKYIYIYQQYIPHQQSIAYTSFFLEKSFLKRCVNSLTVCDASHLRAMSG